MYLDNDSTQYTGNPRLRKTQHQRQYRQNKIFTDVVGAYNYSGVSSELQDNDGNGIYDIKEQLEGELMYRAFAGNVLVWTKDGKRIDAGSPYTTILGGISTIRAIAITTEGLVFGDWNTQSYSAWVNENAPLPTNVQGGDSGSPVYVYNKEAGRYEYVFSARASNFTTYGVAHGAIDFANAILDKHSVTVDMSSTDTAYMNAVTGASGTISLGNQQISHVAINSGYHTWKNLDSVKDNDNWYAYGNHLQNSFSVLGSTENLIFNGSGSENTHRIIMNATVDTGIGYLEFNKGKFIIQNAEGGDYTLNSAGYIINEGAEVHVQLTNPADYMREWRKNGEGDLYIEGSGDNNILLAVGGGGTTYLQREGGGHAAYNVLASSGASVVIADANQIERDFTFGLNGGTLDMNGNSMDWYTTNPDIAAEGFSINALTDDAIITNSSGNTTLIYKQSGNTTWKGSLKDSAGGSLSIVADMGQDSVWTMNSICTDLSQNAESSFSVKSGTVILAGTNTEHGTGSVPFSDAVFFSEDDWHYADAKMQVTVESGAEFRLGTHARLKGDITVKEGGVYVMNEGVHHRMEYIEGGVVKEDTSEWADYYGHHGDTKLEGGSLQVVFDEKTTATHTYGGNITGNGSVTVDAANSILLLTGNNDFTGTRRVTNGTLMVEDADAAGNTKWVVEEKGIFSAKDATGEQILSYIDGSSTGVLALSKNQTSQIDTSGHTGLIIGALAGERIQYGELGTSEQLIAYNGVWKLGGGGGELVVNYCLTGDNMLVLGNANTKGVVTLTNTGNNFTGGIDFAGSGVTLEYAGPDAIKNVTLNLTYGNRVAMGNLISNVRTESDGILLQNQTNQDVDLSGHHSLSLGTREDLNYSGKISLADNQAYRLTAADGTFTINSEIGGEHDLIVDAQGHSGGTVKLNNLNNLTGDVTVMGHRDGSGGDITLLIDRDGALNSAEEIHLKKGGTLDIATSTQKLGKLVMEEGSSLTGHVRQSNADLKGGELHLTIDSLSDIQGSISVDTIHKYGSNVLELDNDLSNTSNLQYRELFVEEGDVKVTADYAQIGTVRLVNNNTFHLNGKYIYLGHLLAEDGAVIDASVANSVVGSYFIIGANSGTVTMTNGTNNVKLNGSIGAAAGATLRLIGSGNWEFSNDSYNSAGGTLRIEDADNLTFTYGENESKTYDDSSPTTQQVHVYGTLDLTEGITEIRGGATCHVQELNFDTIQLNGQNLALNETTNQVAWYIENLQSDTPTTVTWNASKTTTSSYRRGVQAEYYVDVTEINSSRLILTGENTFNGTIIANRTASGKANNTYVELAHNKALQHGVLQLNGLSTSSMSLAVNTENAQIKGLIGNEYAHAYSGASSRVNLDSAAEGNGLNTLTITGDGSYEYKGSVSGLSLAMNGSGTQTFSSSNINAQNISALSGRMVFTTAPTVADTVSIAQGATLKLGDSFSLNQGVTLAMIAGSSGTQGTLESALILNGGTLRFDSAALSADTSLLSADIGFGTEFTAQAVSFSNLNQLKANNTYTLLSGDWSGREAYIAEDMPDYLRGSVFTANASGLQISVRLAENFAEWQNNKDIFTADNTVLFRDTEPDKALSFTQTTTAKNLRFINHETYTFSGSDVVLQENLQLESGKLILNNKLSAVDYTAAEGELVLGDNGVLELTATRDSTATVHNISGTGTLRLKLDTTDNTYGNILAIDSAFEGTTHVAEGNLTLSGSTFGKTLKLANGVNAQITEATVITGNIELEGSSQIHQNGGNTLTVSGNVYGSEGTWVRCAAGTLNLDGDVTLNGFDTGANGSTNNFNGSARINNVVIDNQNITVNFNNTAEITTATLSNSGVTANFNGSTHITTATISNSEATANFNGDATVDTLNPTASNVRIGGTGSLTVGNFNLTAGKNITIDGLSVKETTAQTRSWNNASVTSVNLKNGAVLDTRHADYRVQRTITVGGTDADGIMYVNGICLAPISSEAAAASELNVTSGAQLIITGDVSGNTNSDFVLACYGDAHYYMSYSSTINVGGTLTSNAEMTLMHNNANLHVKDGGVLNLLKGLTLNGSCKTNMMEHTVYADLNVESGGRLNAARGEQHANLRMKLEAGSTLGAIGSAGSTVSFTNNMTLGTDGKEGVFTIDTAATEADEQLLLTRSADKGVTVDMTGNLNLKGNTTVEVIGSGTLRHKSAFNNATAIRVQEGAALSVSSGTALTAATELNKGILELDSATVSSGEVAVTGSATVRAAGGVSTVSAATRLTDEATLTYDISGGATLNSSGSLTAEGARGSLIKQGSGALRLNSEANALANIQVDAGELSMHGAAAYDLNDLEAATSTKLSFYVGAVGNTDTEASVRVGGIASFASGAVLNANLSLTIGSTLEVAEGGLAMGSTLTLEQGITLGDSTLARVRSLSVGESTTLFRGVDGLALGNKEYTSISTEDSILASPYFSNLSDNYVLTYTGTDNGSLSITMMSAAVPEPTTTTLSLLALSALAARRRRK